MEQTTSTQPARATLRIVPHPDPNRRTWKSAEKRNEQGVITRKAGTQMFTYLVQGTDEEIARFRLAKGRYLVQDTDKTVLDAYGREVTNPYYGSYIVNSQDEFTKPRGLVFTRATATKPARVVVTDDPFEIRLSSFMRKASKFGAAVEQQAASKVTEALFNEMFSGKVSDAAVQSPASTSSTPQSLAQLAENGIANDAPDGQESEVEGEMSFDEE